MHNFWMFPADPKRAFCLLSFKFVKILRKLKNSGTAIFENNSPQKHVRLKRVKYEILILSSVFRYSWLVALNKTIISTLRTHRSESHEGLLDPPDLCRIHVCNNLC